MKLRVENICGKSCSVDIAKSSKEFRDLRDSMVRRNGKGSVNGIVIRDEWDRPVYTSNNVAGGARNEQIKGMTEPMGGE